MWAANLSCFNSGVVFAKRTPAAQVGPALHTYAMNAITSNKIHPHVTNDIRSNENVLHMCPMMSNPIGIFSTSYHLYYYQYEDPLRVTIEITSNKFFLHT
jgi:hypothetical protein